jgi:hypothetical protein
MWQTNPELETVGWPVVPLEAFSDPKAHSTTANGPMVPDSFNELDVILIEILYPRGMEIF